MVLYVSICFPHRAKKKHGVWAQTSGAKKTSRSATKNTDGVARSGRMWENGGTWDAMMVPKMADKQFYVDYLFDMISFVYY